MWKCPKCETTNEGDFCIICGEARVAETIDNRGPIVLEKTEVSVTPNKPKRVEPQPVRPPKFEPPKFRWEEAEARSRYGVTPPPVKKKSKAWIGWLIIVLIVLAVIGAMVAYEEEQYDYYYEEPTHEDDVMYSAQSCENIGDYIGAYRYYQEIDYYEDAANAMERLKPILYSEARNYYEDALEYDGTDLGETYYDEAADRFELLGDYADSAEYLDMIIFKDYE